jgi:hypothetical protein
VATWFTNKGQMIQVACAVVAATVALMVWFAVPPQKLLYVAPIVTAICFVWVSKIAAEKFSLMLVHARAYERLQATQSATAPSSEPVGASRRAVALHVAHIRCKVGDFWEGAFGGVGNFRVIVHAISKVKGQNEHRADVEVSKGVGHLT